MTQIFRKRGIDTSHFEGKAEFVARVHEVMEMARDKFPTFDIQNNHLPIVFFKTGAHAGTARWRSKFGQRQFNVEFNTVAIKGNREDMLSDTIPHEIAHIVDIYINGSSDGHGPRWKRIAKSLGCGAKRTHSYDMTEAKRTRRRAVYVATCGTELKVSIQTHNKIQQRGQVRQLTSTRGKVGRDQFTGRIVSA
jgi:predicted SprT family Zn-dependent metalloprotease